MNTFKEKLLFDHLKWNEGKIDSVKSFCRFVSVFKATFFQFDFKGKEQAVLGLEINHEVTETTTEKSNTKLLSTYLLKCFSQIGQNQLYLRA